MPLSGTASWTSGAGQIELLYGSLTATLGFRPGGGEFEYSCFMAVEVFDNRTAVAEYRPERQEPRLPSSRRTRLHRSSTSTNRGTALTATANFDSCRPGSSVDQVHLIVAPLGA